MIKTKFRSTLFWNLSLTFLTVLIVLGTAYVLITAHSAQQYYQETTQRLNSHVAEHMLLEVSPFTDGEVNEEAVGKIMHSMMAVNPTIEVYLISPTGDILSHVVLDKEVRLKNVDLNPIKAFIDCGGEHYVLGDDPRNPGEKAVFSATEVYEDETLMGYVYIVLASQQFSSVSEALFGSYFLKVGTGVFVLTLVGALAIGLVLIRLLTKNLRKIQSQVKSFENGDYHARIKLDGKGEFDDLARTFNNMADTILRNMDELKEVDRLRRDLIANVSHDLRSPLSVIHGYVETLMIKDKDLSQKERDRYFDIILRSSDKLKKLVSDLFELSKLEAKQVKLEKEPFLLNELLLDASSDYTLQASQNNISLKLDIPERFSMLQADIGLINRVIQNLLDNAIKYTPEGGDVEIQAKEEEEYFEVQIINSGSGIPKADLPDIFNRYYMSSNERSNSNSTGLGLAIVKKIIDLHGAAIEVDSVVGEFTSFSIRLPKAA